MDIIQIVRILTDASYSCINLTSRVKFLLDMARYRKVLEKNKELKRRFEGETCYILGKWSVGKNVRCVSPEGQAYVCG